MVMDLAAYLREVDRIIIANTTGQVTAPLDNQLRKDLANSVQFLGPAPTPAIRNFVIQSQPVLVDPGTVLSGNHVFDWTVVNAADLESEGTIDQDGSNLSTTVDVAAQTVTLTINTDTLSAGQSAKFTLTVARTDIVDDVTGEFTVTARTDDDYVYFDTQVSPTASNFVFGSAGRTPAETETQSFVIPSFTGSEYVAFAQKSSLTDPTEIIIDGLDQAGAFTKNAAAIVVNLENYDVWITNRAQQASALSGETVRLVR